VPSHEFCEVYEGSEVGEIDERQPFALFDEAHVILVIPVESLLAQQRFPLQRSGCSRRQPRVDQQDATHKF
jgi:hypothetical protein